ncbi:MAG: hypothetical protein ACFFCQ_17430, partial [Promethearchaeota archaeon]
ILNPVIFITGTGFSNLKPLVDSVELFQPEFRTIALLNLVIIIVALSAILHWAVVGRRVPEAPEIQKIDTRIEFEELDQIMMEEEEEEEEEEIPAPT